jgi:iron complex transport system substrate-binding protein
MKRRVALRGLGALGAASLAGCAGLLPGSSAGSGSREVLDGAGRTVDLPEAVDRIVALGPGSLRQVAYFAATDRVVGVERAERHDFRTLPYNAANPGLRKRPVIGSAGPEAAGNAESILEVEPDVVFLSSIGGTGPADRLQAQTGIPVVVLNMPFPLDEAGRNALFETWRLVGRVLRKPDRAQTLVTTVTDHVAALGELVSEPGSVRAYAGGVSYKGAQGLRTTRVPYPPFEFVGVRNVASSVGARAGSVSVSPERLLEWDPGYLFCSAQNLPLVRDDLARRPELRSLSAIQEGRSYALLPVSHYHENVGSMLVDAYHVAQEVAPDEAGAVSLGTTADRIYCSLLGTSPFETVRRDLDAFERVDLTREGAA